MRASADWSDFFKLVEATMRVEKSLIEENVEKEVTKGGRAG